jgi:3',5'-cyclic AMP phosphodiesterase CpdA
MEKPVRIFLSYASEDYALAQELAKHLKALERAGEVSVWHIGMVTAAAEYWDRHKREMEAQMIIVLISADFLASDLCIAELDLAVHRRRAEATPVVAIAVRAVAWSGYAPLGELQVLPRDGKPVVSWSSQDEAWAEIVREVRTILQFGAHEAAPQPQAARTTLSIRPIRDIFKTVGPPDITFVEPAQLKRLRVFQGAMGQGLVVEGPSGVGKTTIVKWALRELQATPQEWLLGSDEADCEKLDARLREGFRGHLVVDDFHRLDRIQQARIANAMKVIADRDTRDAKITVIGINPVGDSLVSALRDVAGRFEVIAIGRQPPEKVSELIHKGEEAANVIFRRRDELIIAAAGSFATAQQLCLEAALKADVDETQRVSTPIDVGFRDVVGTVIEKLDSKYFGDLRSFACHDEKVPPRGAGLALLWLLSQSEEGHVTLDDVRYRFPDPDVRASLTLFKGSFLSRCFDETPNLKSLLYYNKSAGVLSLEDPQLAFYLRHMPWPRFITRTGHRNARIDLEGNLVFSRREPSDRPPPDHVANVLHLSDLHFNQLAQADVWYGQLAADLEELECDRIDALVLSGDLTQRADQTELEAAHRFLVRLSTDFRLSPGQVVMVPGNHDLSWALSEAAYSFHRRKELPAPLPEGTFIAHGTEVVEVRDEARYARRFEPFAGFYGQIKGSPYPLDYAEQFDVQELAEQNILFVAFNSAWQIDHHFRSRASIHPEALTRALARLRQSPAYATRLKIAVWHHPLTGAGEDRIADHGFMQQLAKAGFRLVLHGHIHKAEAGLFRYDMAADGRRIDVVSAGTFGAPTRDWVPGYPLQYNLLRIAKDRVVVATRRREEPNGAWHPDARWLQGPGKDPIPRYEIAVASGGGI